MGGLTNVLPLTGLGEMTDIVKGTISAVKTVGYEKDQCESLAGRFDSLIAVADTVKDLAEFAKILRQVKLSTTKMLFQLRAMKVGFEKKIGHKSRLSRVLCAHDRLQAYECLSCEVTDLMERFQFITIDAYKLSYEDQGTLTQPSRLCIPSTGTGTIDCRPSPVRITHHFGRLGKLRVVCTSYFSHSDHSAKAEAAEEELKQLSRVRHKNIAAIVGVTKGCDGLDGYVVAMEGVPVRLFLAGSVSGDALGRYPSITVESCETFMRPIFSPKLPSVAQDRYSVTVTPDGRVTVLPSSGSHFSSALGNKFLWFQLMGNSIM
ncbi:hypothetical protein BDV93DRAFT_509540 [Ceratobasidium sp. AG-I]|nr:hypothetical protein BDV93DRAFT_509540 [Ceratobasidium sp. AG-I]